MKRKESNSSSKFAKYKVQQVLIVHNYYQIPGGEDTVVLNEKELLEKHGHKVVLYSRNNQELKGKPLRKLLLPITMIFSVRTYRDISRLIRENRIDLVHVHNTLSLISPSVYYAALRRRVPVVQTIHNFRLLCPAATLYREGLCEDCIRQGLSCAIKHRCYRDSLLQTLGCVINLFLHRRIGVYQRLNYICLTEFNRDKLLEMNKHGKQRIDQNKIYIKPNFVEIYRKVIPFAERKNQFIFAGRLDKTKGVKLLLEAWKEIETNELILCGTGPEQSWCKDYIRENGLKNVKLLGLRTRQEVLELIAESKALILPTQWYEGFPMTIIESLACGTPVIGSNIGNVGNILIDGVNGLTFQYNSITGLREAVSRLFDMCGTSRNYYESHYSGEDNYQLLYSIYEQASYNNQIVR